MNGKNLKDLQCKEGYVDSPIGLTQSQQKKQMQITTQSCQAHYHPMCHFCHHSLQAENKYHGSLGQRKLIPYIVRHEMSKCKRKYFLLL